MCMTFSSSIYCGGTKSLMIRAHSLVGRLIVATMRLQVWAMLLLRKMHMKKKKLSDPLTEFVYR